jgi:DNA-binding transcriptional MerR regulator
VDDEQAGLTVEELAERAGVSVRTVRYYISQGLLPGPDGRGRAAAYKDDHLARLLLIRRLADQHVPLAEQRQRLEGLTLPEVTSLLGEEERHGAALEQAEAARSPRDYVGTLLARARAARSEPGQSPMPRAAVSPPAQLPMAGAMRSEPARAAPSPMLSETWHTWQLAPGIELRVRADLVRMYTRLIERLLETAREAPGRDPGSGTAVPHGGPPHGQ